MAVRVLLLLCFVLASICEVHAEIEPNDTLATSNQLLADNSGNLHALDDEDWYGFEIVEPTTVAILFDSFIPCCSTFEWEVSVRDGLGTTLAAVIPSISASTDESSRVSTGLIEPGSYFVVVQATSSSRHSTREYTLSFSMTPSVDGAETESNDTRATADDLTPQLAGNLHSPDDEDWYQFEIAEPATVSVLFDSWIPCCSTFEWEVSVRDELGTTLAAVIPSINSSTDEPTQVSAGLIEPGTYFVVVQATSSSRHSTREYTLSFSMTPGVGGAETENNDTLATADDLSPQLLGNLHSLADEDWYRFEIAEPTTVTILFDSLIPCCSTFEWEVSVRDELSTTLAAVIPSIN